MKTIIALCFFLGIVLGYLIPRTHDAGGGSGGKSARKSPSFAQFESETRESSPIRKIEDRIEIRRDRLEQLLLSQHPTALSADIFYSSNASPLTWKVDGLGKWAHLDPGDQRKLLHILSNAAKSRREWEKANVKVDSPTPGKWILQYPGDKGKAREELKQQIESAFPPDRAMAIQLGGDLDNFFGLGSIQPEFKNGAVEISITDNDPATAPKSKDEPVTFNMMMKVGENETSIETKGAKLDYLTIYLPFLELIGTPEEIHQAASESSGNH